MANVISDETMEYVGILAKLELSPEEKEEAKEQAEKIKSVITDDTLNKLAKYVHKELGLSELNCDYDINKERCRTCKKRELARKI